MFKTLATLAIPIVLVVALGFGATAIVGRDPPPTQWVNWGGESFSNPAGVRRWLRAHGLDYRGWARNHPGAAARLEGRGRTGR